MTSRSDSSHDLDTLLSRARLLELKTGRLARSHYAGLYASAFRGQGMEFADVREYSEGDDVRLIDWKVSARSPSLYVKRMVEERERSVLLVLDASGSTRFGSIGRTKFDLLTEVAALLVLAGFYAKDRVSLALVRESVERFVPAAKGWNHAARLIREMVGCRPGGSGRDFGSLWNFINSPGVPRSLVLLLTDFQAPLAAGHGFSAACRKHEIVVFLASDPREWDLPRVGRIRIRNPETGTVCLVNTNDPELRRDYASSAAKRRSGVLELLGSQGIDSVELSTSSGYEASLRRFLEARRLRGAGRTRTEYRRP